ASVCPPLSVPPVPTRRSSDLLRELSAGVLDALEPILRDRQAHTEIVGEAPDVLGNLDRLKQAVTNLVENASRFIAPGWHIVIERSEEHTSELQSRFDLVCRLL